VLEGHLLWPAGIAVSGVAEEGEIDGEGWSVTEEVEALNEVVRKLEPAQIGWGEFVRDGTDGCGGFCGFDQGWH
jgi:hypothetical protein